MDLENLLKTFTAEKDEYVISLSSRVNVLKGYSSVIDSIIDGINKAIALNKHNKDIAKKEWIDQEAKLNETKLAHKHEIDGHVSIIKGHIKSRNDIVADISDKENRRDTVDKKISGLMTEYRGVEEQLVGIRGQVSVSERRLGELTSKEEILNKSISEKMKIDSDLDVSIEHKKKEHAKVLEDITILNSRK